MKAVVFDKCVGHAQLRDVPIPEPAPGEALVRVIRVGLCNTDLEIMKGYAGFEGIIGHEFVGRIEKIVPSNDQKIIEGFNLKCGQRVCGEINVRCHRCDICKADDFPRKRNHCPNRTVMGILKKAGTYADYLTLPLENLIALPDTVSDSQACFVEPLAAACRIIEQGLVRANSKVAVVGDGKLGLLITQVVHQVAQDVTIFGHHSDKMHLCPNNVNKIITSSKDPKLMETIQSKFGNYFDVCIEVTGNMDGLMFSCGITRPMGTLVLKSTCASAGGPGFNTSPFVVKEITIVGSRCGPFDMAISMLAQGKVDVKKLVCATYPFHKAMDAIKHAGQKGALKVQMIMETEKLIE